MRKKNKSKRARAGGAGFIVLFLGAAVFCRLPFVFFSRFFDSDDALNGLMALSVLRGDVPLYYWGQGYLNSITPLLAAFFLYLVPDGQVAVKLVSLLLHAGGAWVLGYMVWRASGWRSAAIGVLLAAALLPAPLAGMTMGAGSPAARNLTILCGVGCWALFLKFPRVSAGFLAGALAGIGYWNEPPALLFLAPPGLWLLYRGLGSIPAREAYAWLRWLGAAAAGFLLGAAPHIYGLATGQVSIRPGPEWHFLFAAPGKLLSLLVEAVPRLFGAGVSGGVSEIAAPAALLALAFLAYEAHLAAFARKGSGIRIPVLYADVLAGVFLFAYAIGPADPSGSGRYLVFIWPAVALLAGIGAAHAFRTARAALIVVLAVYGVAFAACLPAYWRASAAWDVRITPAIKLLEQNELKGAFANYWAANLITLKLRESVIVAQFTGVPLRHRRYYDSLRGMERVGYLFNSSRFSDDARMRKGIAAALAGAGVGYASTRTDGWELIVPKAPLPIGVINELRLAPGREEIQRRIERLNDLQRSLRKTSRTSR